MIGDYISSTGGSRSPSAFLRFHRERGALADAAHVLELMDRVGSFVRFLASITEIVAESLTVTDGIQGDPVSHRGSFQIGRKWPYALRTIIDWLSMYGLTNIHRFIGNKRAPHSREAKERENG